MEEALDFLKENNEVAFATIGNGRPQMRVFQIMKQSETTLWFATGPHKRVYAELQENPAVEILSRSGNISVRVSGDAVFDIPDDICKEIYETNPVLPGRASAASISMLIFLAQLRENVYFCDDEVFRSDIVSAVVPIFRGQAGQRERGLICRKPVFCFRAFVIRECC